MRPLSSVVVGLLVILFLTMPVACATEEQSVFEQLFDKTVKANAKGAESGDYSELNQCMKEMLSFMDAHLQATADYLVNKRLVGDDRNGVPILGKAILHYCETASDDQVYIFLQRLLAAPDYGKRCFFMSFFWQPTEPDALANKIAQFCMRYLDERQVADDVAWALFGYLGAAREFYAVNTENSQRQIAWIRKHALQSQGMYGYFANKIMMQSFPWSRELADRFERMVVANADPFVWAGIVEGLTARLRFCVRFKMPNKPNYRKTNQDYQQKLLIPASDLHRLATVAAKNMQHISAVTSPISALRLDIHYQNVSLPYYLGVVDYDSEAGKELLSHFVESAPIKSVLEHFVDANRYLGEFGKTLFPILGKRYGDVIFSRVNQGLEQKNDVGDANKLFDFVTAYFSLPSIPEKDKKNNLIIWQKIVGNNGAEVNK